MKKICSLVFAFMLFFIPCSIKAYNSGIEKFKMDVTILDNGDVKVKEAFKVNGNYSGFERILEYRNINSSKFNPNSEEFGGSDIHNATDIKLVNIATLDNINDFNTINSSFKEVESAKNGNNGVYTKKEKTNGYSYLIYNPSRKNKTFYLEYIIKDAVIMHNDVAELGWNIFGDKLVEEVYDLEITIHIPNNKTMLKGWAHGPLNGDIEIKDINTVLVTINNLDAKTAMDVRLAFDKTALVSTKKNTNVNALDKIISYEERKANEANQLREQYRKQKEKAALIAVEKVEDTKRQNDYDLALYATNELSNKELKEELKDRLNVILKDVEAKEKVIFTIATTVRIITLAGSIYLIYNFYKKYDKEYKPTFTGKYYRDFPSDNDPEIVGYLVDRSIQNKDLSAAILNLINKKVIKCEKLDKKDYRLDYNDKITLTEKDQLLIKFLFGKETTTTLNAVKKRATNSYDSFLTNYSKWKTIVLNECEQKNFFEKRQIVTHILFLILIIAINIFVNEGSLILGGLNIVIAIIGFVYIGLSSKRSKEGNEEYVKWIGLKNFMQDFGRMDKKDLPELILWEKYLVYAVSLNCADTLAKTMEIRVKEFEDTIFYNDFGYSDILFITSFNRVINHSINQSVMAATTENISSSNNSSGGGFGGGFSSGGGSFGGGGGGGRF